MTRRTFDRFMVAVELSSNPKIGRLNDCEFRCLLTGVWPLAAKSQPRGYLLVGPHAATEKDVSHQARCTVTVARRTLAKLRELGMLERDEETDWERCHDWDELNPPPKTDANNATRQRRYRERRNGVTQPLVTEESNGSNGGEVEEKEKGKNNKEAAPPVDPERIDQARDRLARGAVQRVFDAWIESTGKTSRTELDPQRRSVITKALKTYPEEDVIDAVRGWKHDPHNRGENDRGKPFNDIELLLRNASHIEKFRDLERASAVDDTSAFIRAMSVTAGTQ